tara:strand:- start:59 stop:163 length:105 start_codon:yes stop_codon:yes gene_type:complete
MKVQYFDLKDKRALVSGGASGCTKQNFTVDAGLI